MANTLLRKFTGMELEEKILNAGVLISLVGLFLPWFGGRWLGQEVRTHTGFGFYTSFIGFAIAALHVYVLLITLLPMLTHTVLVRRSYRNTVRLCCTGIATILILACLSVLMRVTFEFQSMEVRFGIYLSLFGSMAATFYAFLTVQEQRRRQVQELFHHPDESPMQQGLPLTDTEEPDRTPPPPPPPPEIEEHPMHR